MPDAASLRAVEAVWRIEAPRLIAGLARVVHDLPTAEDLAQDALVAALEQWPREGVPGNPGAWLMATARHRGVDTIRRAATLQRKAGELGRALEHEQAATGDALVAQVQDAGFGDELLRLVFTACHPALGTDAQVALTLRVLGGLTTREIARAFLADEATIAQRVSRAKRTLRHAGVALEAPSPDELAQRTAAVLGVVYLVFNEGYAASTGADWMRTELVADALRLGRVLAGLLAREPEVHGLVALMELQASRTRARVTHSGEPILLPDQDRSRWDRLLVRRGLAALERANALAPAPGPYTLQAAIAACHARARTAKETDWVRIAALYEALALQVASPVVQLNRAVALGMAFGPAAGLELTDALVADGALAGYHLLPSVRGDLLARLGRDAEAKAEFEHAARLAGNARERDLLRRRAVAAALAMARPTG